MEHDAAAAAVLPGPPCAAYVEPATLPGSAACPPARAAAPAAVSGPGSGAAAPDAVPGSAARPGSAHGATAGVV